MIYATNVTKSYGKGTNKMEVLKNITLSINRGEFVSITGRSGSGKSTLLYQLGLLDFPDGGEIWIDNTEVTKLSKEERTNFRLEKLGYIFQDYALLPELNAYENVAVPLIMMGQSVVEAETRAKEALSRVGLKDRLGNLPSELSGGQQQLVSIARAITHNPKILFADEPTANLDTTTAKMILDTFLELNRNGQTIIMVTHEAEFAKLAHRTIILSDGMIILG